MPMTFPSHAAAVLPFKFARRRWFDGVALVIGSAAPDFPYSIAPYAQYNAHTWLGLLVFCVPVTVLLTWLTRRAAPTVAHLPAWTGDYAALRQHRFPGTSRSCPPASAPVAPHVGPRHPRGRPGPGHPGLGRS